jgi:DMSO reductase anchor subunit
VHPAKSVIFFTTASGAGYGLAIWLCILGALGLLPADQTLGLVGFGSAMSLIVAGLMSSTLHLGHPERAWRALSQWRSSWLSREGVAAVVTFAPIGLYALCWLFLERNTGWPGLIGVSAAAASLVTVYCTAMIYASLKTIPAWSNPWTAPAYLILSLSTGGMLTLFLMAAWNVPVLTPSIIACIGLAAAALAIKLGYWRKIDNAGPRSTAETATGLGNFGKVRLIDAPHTQSNYLLDEMGFKIARKHSQKLRQLAVIAGFLLPIAVLGLAITAPGLVLPMIGIAVLASGFGVVVERWLFFAEAKHVVTLYYGESGV